MAQKAETFTTATPVAGDYFLGSKDPTGTPLTRNFPWQATRDGFALANINTQTGTSYTLALTDQGDIVEMNNAGANTLTIPTNAAVAFPVGTRIRVTQFGAGTTTVQGDTGVTVNGTSAGSEAISGQFAHLFLYQRAVDDWLAQSGGGGGGMEFIASQDLSAAATADFTGFDATKYDAYVFKLMNVTPATDAPRLWLRTSTDGGVSYDSGASDYHWTRNRIENAAGATLTTEGDWADSAIEMSASVGGAAGEDGYSGTVDINGPHLAKKTHVAFSGSYQDVNGNLGYIDGFGMRVSSADVDAIRFLFDSGNIASGTITMYGLRNAP